MKIVFLDYLRRWRWVFVLVWLFAAGFSLVQDIRTQRMALMSSVFCGPLLLAFDRRKGCLRVLSMLPMPIPMLTSLLWCMAVLLPVLIAAGGSLTGILIGALFLKTPGVDIVGFVISTLAVTVWTGAAFLTLTYLPTHAPAPGFANQAKATLAGGAWGLSMGGSMLLGMWAPVDLRQFSIGLLLFIISLLVATVVGFGRVRTIFPGQESNFDSVPGPGAAEPPRVWRPTPITGEWFAFLAIVKGSFLASLAIFLALLGGFSLYRCVLMGGGIDKIWDAFSSTGAFGVKMGSLAGAMLGMAWMGSLRQLRVLPVSAGRIAFAGSLCVWIPVICFSGIIASLTLIARQDSTAVECLRAGVIGGSIAHVLLALFMRVSSVQLRWLMFMVVWMTIQVGGVVFTLFSGPFLILSPLLVVSSWLIMRYTLLTRSEPYKTLPMFGTVQQVR